MINLKQKILDGITNREYEEGSLGDFYYLTVKLGWFKKVRFSFFP